MQPGVRTNSKKYATVRGAKLPPNAKAKSNLAPVESFKVGSEELFDREAEAKRALEVKPPTGESATVTPQASTGPIRRQTGCSPSFVRKREHPVWPFSPHVPGLTSITMQFLTVDQAQMEPYRCQYRHSTITVLLGAWILMSIAAACTYFAYAAWTESSIAGVLIAGWIGLWAVLLGLLLWGIARRRLLPSNWLVRTHSEGISVKFRSYLNSHFDPSDPIVVHIAYSEIEYIRDHRIRQDVPGQSRGDVETRYLRFAEFKLRDDNATSQIEESISRERTRKAPMGGRLIRYRSKYDEYPVQVADGLVRIRWSVWPRLGAFIADISQYVPVKDRLSSHEDFRDLRKASPRDQEDALLGLIAAGDRFGAIRMIRQIYGFDLTRSIQFLDDFSNTKPQGADTK